MTSPSTVHGVVVVPGGTGNVGEGIVRAFLQTGATVVVPSRNKDRLAQLTEHLGPELTTRLHGIVGAHGTFAEADELAEQIKAEHGRIDHVVPSIGGWWMGKALWQTSEAQWQQFFVETTTAHAAVARAFVPRLEPAGSYTLISGFSAQKPYPSAGIVSMHGAALLMMREVLSAELDGQRRVNDLILGPIINRSRPHGSPDWLTADQVGQAAVLVATNPTIHDEHITLDNRADLGQLQRRVPAGDRA
jgi:NAD(P)-dependent dehydrogenase (short-subunit alcohol dehydrogenase family)